MNREPRQEFAGQDFLAQEQTMWDQVMDRRGMLRRMGRVAGVALAVHSADILATEAIRTAHDEPTLTVFEPEAEPIAKFRDHLTVLLPGLGVSSGSAVNMVHTIKPAVERYGAVGYVRYADSGLNDYNFRRTADTLQSVIQERQVRHLNFICHSAGGPNLARVLRTPVEQYRRFFGFSYGASAPLMDAYKYWQESFGVGIDSVTYVSSPPTGDYIKGDLQQGFAKGLNMVPEQMLRGGMLSKFVGSLVNNHTIGYGNFEAEWPRLTAAWRSAFDDATPTNFVTQVNTIQSMDEARYQGTVSPETRLFVIRPTRPERDKVVLTGSLPAAWARMHGRDADDVRIVESAHIGHADISQQREEFSRMFAAIFGGMYPPSPADVRRADSSSPA